jgi:hypothetical protein
MTILGKLLEGGPPPDSFMHYESMGSNTIVSVI